MRSRTGLPVGMGSGLLFTGKQGDALTFATVTDRGPNADSPKMRKNDAKIFVTPDFAPLLMTIRVQNGKKRRPWTRDRCMTIKARSTACRCKAA